MAIVSDIEIRLRADIARLQTDMTAARRTVENSTNAMSAAVEKFKSALGGIAVGAIFAKFQADLISAQREFDKLNASLITATGSIGNAKQAFAALQGFAATTPYDLKQVTEGFLKLRNLGLDPSERALKSYGNTAGAMGKSLNQMVEAVADAATGEFERLKEFGIKAKQNGDFVTLTFQGVTTKIGNNAKDIEKYLMKIGEVNFAGGMELQARTLDGAISNLGDAWDSTLRTFSQAGFGDSAMAKTLALTNALTDLQAVFMATSLAAKEEGKAVSENSVLHKALTTIFETLAVMGEQVGFVMRSIGREIGALVAGAATFFSGFGGGLNALGRAVDGLFKGGFGDSKAVAQGFSDALDSVTGSFKGMLAISEEVTRQGEEDRQMTDARVEKILWAAAVAQKVRENEAEAKERDGLDDLARYKVLGDGKKAQTAAEKKAAEDALSWYKKTKEAAEDKISLLGTELGASDALTDGQKKAIAVLGDLVKFSGNLTAEQKRRIALLTEEELRLERLTEARKADKKAQEEAEAAARKDTDTAWDKVRSSQEQVKTYGLTETAVLQLQAAEYQRQAGAAELSEVEQQRLSMLLAATQEQIKLQTKLDKMKAATTFWTSMESAAHDMFMSIDKGNSNLWQRMKDSAKNMFFEWLYQMTLKKWIINIGTEISGASGVSGIAGAVGGESGGGALGMFSSMSSLYSAGKAIYSGFSTGIASSLGTMIQGLGQTFGSAAVTSFGAGMQLTTAEAAAAAGTSAGAASGGALSAGASAASMVPVIGWIVAGMMANNSYFKQGWKLDNQKTDITKELLASTLKGNFLGAIGATATVGIGAADTLLRKLGLSDQLASLFSGSSLWARAFGRQSPTVETQGLKGTISAGGIDATNYATILEKGGWFRSDKRTNLASALSAEADAQFDGTIKAMITAVKGFGNVLGIQTANIDAYTKTFDIKLTGDAAKDNAAIAQLFTDVGNELSVNLVPSLTKFATEGETASATLQRLVTDYMTVDNAMAAVGKTMGVIGEAGIAAREGLITAAGGLDKLTSGLAFFQQNFLTEAEQLAPVQKQVAEALAAVGMSSIKNAEQFKAAALGLDVTTQAGQELFAKMLALAPAFKVVADAADAAAKAAADLAAQQAAAAAAAAQAAAEAKAKALADNETLLRGQVSSALDQLKTAVDARKESLKSSFDDLMASLSASIDSWGVKITNLKSLSSLLAGAKVGATQSAASRETAQAQIEAALAIAKASGVLPSADSLKDAIGAVTADSSSQFATLIEYQRDQARASRSIAGLAGLTDDQLTTAEKTLQVLQNQKASADAAYTRQISALDAIVTAGEKAASIALGTYQATLSVDAGIATVAAAIAALKLGATTSNPIGAGMTVADLYTQVLGRAPDAGGLAFWQKAFGDMVDSSEYAQFIAGAAPELAAKASGTWAQWLAAHGAANTIPSGQSSDMQTALDTFNAQVSGMQAALDRTAKSTQQLADQFNAVSAGGNALLTESA